MPSKLTKRAVLAFTALSLAALAAGESGGTGRLRLCLTAWLRITLPNAAFENTLNARDSTSS